MVFLLLLYDCMITTAWLYDPIWIRKKTRSVIFNSDIRKHWKRSWNFTIYVSRILGRICVTCISRSSKSRLSRMIERESDLLWSFCIILQKSSCGGVGLIEFSDLVKSIMGARVLRVSREGLFGIRFEWNSERLGKYPEAKNRAPNKIFAKFIRKQTTSGQLMGSMTYENTSFDCLWEIDE